MPTTTPNPNQFGDVQQRMQYVMRLLQPTDLDRTHPALWHAVWDLATAVMALPRHLCELHEEETRWRYRRLLRQLVGAGWTIQGETTEGATAIRLTRGSEIHLITAQTIADAMRQLETVVQADGQPIPPSAPARRSDNGSFRPKNDEKCG